MSFAPYPARTPVRHRQHGILPVRVMTAQGDWGELALQRTWRTASLLLLLLGVGNAFVARLPAVLFMLAGIWAHFKGHPQQGRQIAAHPVLGAPWRWWIQRGQHRLPVQAPDTTPQM